MATYRTNTAELESIADAIRAKTGGTSSLVYPTGFVSAIESISIPYNWIGEDATLIDTVYEHTYKLSDTSFDASAVTTSSTTILPYQNLTARTIDSIGCDYVLLSTAVIDYQYTITLTNVNRYNEGYYCFINPFGRKPYYTSDFENDTVSYMSTGAGFSGFNGYYTAASNVSAWTANAYGLTVSVNSPTFSNNLQSTPSVTLRTPLIRVVSNSAYMEQAAINALDTENTTIHLKQELYRCNQSVWHGLNAKTVELYKAKHNLT